MLLRGTGISEPMPVAAAFFSANGAGSSLSDIASIDAMAGCPCCNAPVVDVRSCLLSSLFARYARPAAHAACSSPCVPEAYMHGTQVTVVDAASFAERALGGERLVDRALGAGAGDARSVAGLLADQARSPGNPCMPGSFKAPAWRLCKAIGLGWCTQSSSPQAGVLCMAACLPRARI